MWAAPISGPPTFLGDVNFFFLYIAIVTGEKCLKPILRMIIIQIIIVISHNKLRLNVPRMPCFQTLATLQRLIDSLGKFIMLSVYLCVTCARLLGQWRRQGGRGEAPPYGWTSKNYVICVCFHCHGTSSYHTTNTLQGRRAKSHVDTQTIQPGLGDFVL